MLMLWAIFPIFAQLFYTSGGYIQNYLADIAMPKNRAGALIIGRLPAFLVTMMVLFAVFGRVVFVLPLGNALGLVLAGAINIIGSIYYFKALQLGDAADVHIFGQLSPLISLGLGVLILGETITAMQGLGLLLIMVAIVLIIFGDTSKKERQSPNIRVATLVIVSAFFSILSDVVFALFIKGFTADTTLLGQSLFFFEIGSALMVIVLTICFESWRRAFRTAFIRGKNHRRNTFALLCDNVAFGLAEVIYKYGLLVVPVIAMMTAVSKASSLFISIFITIFFGRIFPKFIHGKRVTRKVIAQYIIAAVFIITGIIVMN